MRIRYLHPLTESLLELSIDDDNAWKRVGGGAVCQSCGLKYYDHMMCESILDSRNEPYLHVSCDGLLLKL